MPNRADTALIDMHPTTGSAPQPGRTPPWAPAQIFNDPLRGILIQNLSQDATGATLAITMPVDTTPPSSPGGLSAVTSGTSVSLQWTAAGDDVGVASYRVSRDGTQLAAQTAMTFDDSGLPPGVTVTMP